MLKKLPISIKMFLIFLITSVTLVIIATEQFKEKSYKLQREDLAIQVATASVRLSRAMIKPAGKGDVETIEAILSAFAGSPEIRCVNLNLRKDSISLNWPDEKCTTANPDTMLHKQPIRRGVRVIGEAEIYFTDELIKESISKIILFIYIGLAAIMFVMLFVLVLSQRLLIIAPITKIRNAMSSFDAEIEHARIYDEKFAFEFGSIANSFDEIALKVNAQAAQLLSQKQLLANKNAEIQQSLDYASNVQSRLINLAKPKKVAIDISGICRQLEKVGGDLFYGVNTPGGYVLFFGDATGHGVPGALATSVISVAVRNVINANPSASSAEMLSTIHDQVIIGLEKMDATETDIQLGADALILKFSSDGTISYASAKQPFLIVTKNGAEMTKPNKDSIGYEKVGKTFTEHKVKHLEKHDLIILFTDGIVDAPGGKKGFGFGKKRLIQCVQNAQQREATSEAINKIVIEEVTSYLGTNHAVDDMSIVTIRKN